MIFKLSRADAKHEDFKLLVKKLDAELAIRDGDDHDFYNQFNGITDIKYTVLGYYGDIAVACGAIKTFDDQCMEVKRMYVAENYRSNGYGMQVLEELQIWAKELGYQKCILETGTQQPEAIRLYHKAKFDIIENYGQYAGVINSICFAKSL